MMIALPLVAFYGSLFLSAWGLQLTPDVSLYLSGFSLYPSPLGTLFADIFGYWGMAVVHAVALALIVVALVDTFQDWKALVISAPVLVWAIPLSVDAFAAACLVWFMVLGNRRFVPLVWGWHLAALPTTVGMFLQNRRTMVYGFFAMLLGIAAFLLTPYGSVIELNPSDFLRAVPRATCVMLLACSPLIFLRYAGDPRNLYAILSGTLLVVCYATLAHVQSGVPFGLCVFATSRYCLPLTLFLLVSSVSYGRTRLPKSAAREGLYA